VQAGLVGVGGDPALALQDEGQHQHRHAHQQDVDVERLAAVHPVRDDAAHHAAGRADDGGPQVQPGHLVIRQAQLHRQIALQGQAQAHGPGRQQGHAQAGEGAARADEGAEGVDHEAQHLAQGRVQAPAAFGLPGRVRGFLQGQHHEQGDQQDGAADEVEGALEAELGRHEQGAAAAHRLAQAGAGEHHAVGGGALMLLQGVDGQRVDGHVLGGREDVVHQQDDREQAQLTRQVQHHGGQQRQHHHHLHAQDPAAAPAQPGRGEHVHHRAIGPFEGPGQVEGAHEGADLGRPHPWRRSWVATAVAAKPSGMPSVRYSRKNAVRRPRAVASRLGRRIG
jgi:hypothetical protein